MKTNHFARKKRQLKIVVAEFETAFIDKTTTGVKIAQRLYQKMIHLIKELRQFLSNNELKKTLGSLAFVFGLTAINPTFSQSFEAPVTNPFGLTSGMNLAYPTIADLDNDGDLDILIGDYDYDTSELGFLSYYENIGSAESPLFAAPVNAPFGLTSTEEYIFPAFGDLDNDGDVDLLATNTGGDLIYYKNSGSPTSPLFDEPINNPFGLGTVATEIAQFPDFVDIDNDGDLDLFVGSSVYEYENYATNMLFYENIGTATAPNFAAPVENAFGFVIADTGDPIFPTFGDIDEDGDFDMIGGEFGGLMRYFENTGDANNPAFGGSVLNPFGLSPTYYFALPALADMDNDGDIDLMVGEYYANFVYFENNGGVGLAENDGLASISIYPNPVHETLSIDTKEIVELIEIFDATGKLALQSQNTKQIELEELSPGIYSASIVLSSGQKVIKKIIKK